MKSARDRKMNVSAQAERTARDVKELVRYLHPTATQIKVRRVMPSDRNSDWIAE